MENNHTSSHTQKDTTTFRCPDCQLNSELPVERVQKRPDSTPHPFEYFATCPLCGSEIPEAAFMKNLYRAWLNPTGTKSPEVSAQNLPDPHDGRRRFNALKHGLFAKKAKYFPAKVGQYAECTDCVYSQECEEGGICLEITKLRMMVTRAFDSKNPELLQPLFQDIQSDMFVLLKRMMNQVMADGVALKAPVFCGSKDGPVLVKDADNKQIIETSAHPLIKAIGDLIQKNGLSLSDLQMTPKTQIDQSIALGNLAAGQTQRLTLQQMHEERKGIMEDFLAKMAGSTANRESDPIYQEQKEESG